MTTNPTEDNFDYHDISRRLVALLLLTALVTVIPIIVVTVIWGIVVSFDFGAIWNGLQSVWLAAYDWASQQAIFMQVAIGIALFFVGLPLTFAIVAWGGMFVFGGAFVGVTTYLLTLNREARILFGRSLDDDY